MKDFYLAETDWVYPAAYDKLIELNLMDFDLWFILEAKQAAGIYQGMKERYPRRQLIPFAKRGDNDDTACFEIGKGEKVQIIHDFASEGYEQREEFFDVWAWLETAVSDLIFYQREEQKYYNERKKD